jgi:hypothetical protein
VLCGDLGIELARLIPADGCGMRTSTNLGGCAMSVVAVARAISPSLYKVKYSDGRSSEIAVSGGYLDRLARRGIRIEGTDYHGQAFSMAPHSTKRTAPADFNTQGTLPLSGSKSVSFGQVEHVSAETKT